MIENLLTLIIVMFFGFIYYKSAISKDVSRKKKAFVVKIMLLVLSFVLAFLEKEYLLIGALVFGGRISIMMLVLIEIADTFIDKKNNN